jgi:hypothetical protein
LSSLVVIPADDIADPVVAASTACSGVDRTSGDPAKIATAVMSAHTAIQKIGVRISVSPVFEVARMNSNQ